MTNSTSSAADFLNTSMSISSLIIFSTGIPGNLCMIIVFSQNTLTKLSVSVYFRAMAVANLYICIITIKKFLEIQFGFILYNLSVFICKTYNFLIYTVASMSDWFLVAADLDRFLGLAYPTRFQFIQKGRFPLYVVIVITVYNILFYIQVIFEANLVQKVENISNNLTHNECKTSNEFLFMSDLTNSSIIPFMIMIISSIGMFLVVYNSRRRMMKFKKTTKNSNNGTKRNLKFMISMIKSKNFKAKM